MDRIIIMQKIPLINHKLILAHNFPPGSQVMAWDPLRAVKAEPRYEGPLN